MLGLEREGDLCLTAFLVICCFLVRCWVCPSSWGLAPYQPGRRSPKEVFPSLSLTRAAPGFRLPKWCFRILPPTKPELPQPGRLERTRSQGCLLETTG